MCKELITSAAIKITDNKEDIFIKGVSHGDCITKAVIMYNNPSMMSIDPSNKGFWTNMNRFVDRSEAYKIAKEGNQITNDFIKDILYSENVKYEEMKGIIK